MRCASICNRIREPFFKTEKNPAFSQLDFCRCWRMRLEIAFADWLNLIFRWLHVIAGIAWIGSSFYFIALDLSLKPGKELPAQAHGQAWQVHGGGFYNMVK